ncbi:MFS transporter [Celerinatantimonas diazotrophica]|uniref:GPH family glycoside/pentoside/hexuronide:cation symporter n=1 Tax=Celerinatantimonas diazotrophica TaxID=412034 RepID=A0A4R1J9F7_9GAMM|nr:glycoside-pentoside-hexuronide (GPH):cation symporter [Celerinatantimonas diazotrophica]TCK47057.1 GPH family glycoside/pentoside/hexuronide:cation symporter [Celerinatantimonas diazotrophica]CAG9295825.1 putative symporter YjmB [Celerinatantimonas diazotrophica]
MDVHSHQDQTAVKMPELAKPFGMRDKIGYALGDLANNLTFVISAVFLLKFYTDVMGVSAELVGFMMLVSKVVDAFTDVTMGQLVDRCQPNAKGKFAPWLLRMSGPVAVATVLLFPVWFAHMPMGFKVFWMFFSYLLWGSVCYTGINIPYGSMASAISSDPIDRTALSSWRTVGATVGIMIVGVILPLFVFYKQPNGHSVLSSEHLAVGALVCAFLMVGCYIGCYFMCTERIKVKKLTVKFSLAKLLSSLIHDRALIGIVFSSLLLLVTQLSLTGTGAYIYPNYFGNASAFSVAVFLGVIITFAFTPFVVKLSQWFGKKEISLVSSVVSTVSLFVLYWLHTHNIYVWFVFYAIGYIGIAIFTLVCWAMITDVIDANELKTLRREDGSVYSLYSFFRKIGQALASGLTGIMLSVVGYSSTTAFSQPVVDGIYDITCLIPAISSLAFVIVLWFLYPLNKKAVARNVDALRRLRAKDA